MKQSNCKTTDHNKQKRASKVYKTIEPRNIFLHRNDLVLGDLGLARDAKSIVSSSLSTGMGTISYMAPEIVAESTDYTEKVDVW